MRRIPFARHGSRAEAMVALTFDDGPNPHATPAVLELLASQGVRASFFFIGQWAERHPELVARAARAGHLVGNHSHTHVRGDFEQAERAIAPLVGGPDERLLWIRPPNANLRFLTWVRPSFLDARRVVTFDVDARDDRAADAEEVVARVGAEARNGSIVDLHDGSDREDEWAERPGRMLAALPALLEDLRARFELVRLDELELELQWTA